MNRPLTAQNLLDFLLKWKEGESKSIKHIKLENVIVTTTETTEESYTQKVVHFIILSEHPLIRPLHYFTDNFNVVSDLNSEQPILHLGYLPLVDE